MGRMRDESAKQAAQEYLAAKLSEEEQIYEDTQNRALALARSPKVWKYVKDTIIEKCQEWNAITQEETLTCKETAMGDLRIWCASRRQQMMVHYDSQRLLVTVRNGGRLEDEKDVVMHMEGYRTGAERKNRGVHLGRDEQAGEIFLFLGGGRAGLDGVV